jgi:hypothetical protein
LAEKARVYFPENIHLTEYIGAGNQVETGMKVRYMPRTGDIDLGLDIANLLNSTIGKPLSADKLIADPVSGPYDPQKSRVPNVWGYDPYGEERQPTALLYLLGCYLQHPYNDKHAILQQSSQPEPTSPGETSPSTTVTGGVGTLPAPTPNYLSPETRQSMYTYARLENQYFNLPCRTQLPLTSRANDASPTCAIATLALPQGRRAIHIDFERVGDWPEMPQPMDWYNDGPLWGALLQHWEKRLPPSLAADFNQSVYRVEAYYLYALNRPVAADDTTRIGVLPQTSREQLNNPSA